MNTHRFRYKHHSIKTRNLLAVSVCKHIWGLYHESLRHFKRTSTHTHFCRHHHAQMQTQIRWRTTLLSWRCTDRQHFPRPHFSNCAPRLYAFRNIELAISDRTTTCIARRAISANAVRLCRQSASNLTRRWKQRIRKEKRSRTSGQSEYAYQFIFQSANNPM